MASAKPSRRAARPPFPPHPHAVALTNGYVAGLLAGAAIYAVGAIVAALTINTSLGPDELAAH
jgi:hypothetical protein